MTYPSNPPGNWKGSGRNVIKLFGGKFAKMEFVPPDERADDPASGRIERQRHLVAEMIKRAVGVFTCNSFIL